MALINPQAMAAAGTSPTFAAPTASDTLAPTDRGVYLVRTTGTATTVGVVIPGNDEFGTARPDVSSVLAATDVRAFPMAALVKYADPATGLITVTHSGALTGVTSAYITI